MQGGLKQDNKFARMAIFQEWCLPRMELCKIVALQVKKFPRWQVASWENSKVDICKSLINKIWLAICSVANFYLGSLTPWYFPVLEKVLCNKIWIQCCFSSTLYDSKCRTKTDFPLFPFPSLTTAADVCTKCLVPGLWKNSMDLVSGFSLFTWITVRNVGHIKTPWSTTKPFFCPIFITTLSKLNSAKC